MKRKSLLFLIICLTLCLCSCSKFHSQSSFTIQFIDVGQGDSALVECDGHYMLIDGGDTMAGDKVYNVLEEHQVQHLDILAISHLHQDHIGGLPKALTYASKIDLVISNSNKSELPAFAELENQLIINKATIKIPHLGDKYKLGSADVVVIDASAENNNDSLVLLITYGKTRFMFTGDIEGKAQKRIQSNNPNGANASFKINLIKMPHHGAKVPEDFIKVFDPDYAVISVGKGKQYDHPSGDTLELLDRENVKVYRTDQNGDIIVKSNGTELSVEASQ